MKINQLFRAHVPDDLLRKVLGAFGIDNLHIEHSFCKQDMISRNTVEKVKAMKDEIGKYYLPCKSKLYLVNIDDKKCITILRQMLRLHGYQLISKQKYVRHLKVTVYFIHPISSEDPKQSKEVVILRSLSKPYVVEFD